jgi:hypothetical protein
MRTLISCCLLAAACATDRRFMPRENQNGEGPTGEPAAVYQLAAPMQGEVRLWSDGAERTKVGGRETTHIHLGFEIVNTAAEPLVFDAAELRLQAIAGDNVHVESLAPAVVGGVTAAPPNKTVRCDFQFDPGANVHPRSLSGFEARWTVRLGDQVATQVTPFRPYYPYYPSPWWDGGWGCGWGGSHCATGHHCR